MADDKTQTLDSWMSELYDVSQITDSDIQSWYEEYQYKGFNRKKVLSGLMKLVPDIKEAMQIVVVCALRGPKRAAVTKLRSGRTIESYRIPASGLKGQEGVSCQRITAATADLAAYFLKKMNVPKRLAVDCPAWLQFPSAGSITMTPDLRAQHIEFHKRFSTVIGGVFNEQIYQQMVNNSYLDVKLNLFSEFGVAVPQVINLVPAQAPTFNPARGDVGRGTASDKTIK
jgi:hypothetical protein